MPSERDIEKIEKMVDELGEKEKEIASELSTSKGEQPADEFLDEDLSTLLDDIQTGLEEEKELEEKSRVEEQVEGSGEESNDTEFEPAQEETEEKSLDIESEDVQQGVKDEIDNIREESIEEEGLEEEGGQIEEIEKIADEEAIDVGEEIKELETEEEVDLDLPEDFDLDMADVVEEPPNGFFKQKEKKDGEEKEEQKEISPEDKLVGELEEIIEGVGVEQEEDLIEEDFAGLETEEPSVEELEKGISPEEEFAESGEEEIEKEEEVQGLAEEGFEEESISEEVEVPELETEKEEQLDLEAESEESKSSQEEEVQGIGEIEIPDIEELEKEAEEGGLGEVEEELAEEEREEAPSEVEHIEVGERKEEEIELSDEDIILITTKLKQLNPVLAKSIRDTILESELPLEQLKGLLTLLMRDAPEDEIKTYYEAVTGRKVPIEKIPEVIRVEKKPGPFATIYENLGPLVRVAGLSIVVTSVILAIFMAFFYKPLKSTKYYKKGRQYIKQEEYRLAEQSFNRAVKIYEKIKEYDRFGWEYMISGNYDAAIKKFLAGIKKDKRFKIISLRLHLAKLYNILGEYEKADKIYEQLIKLKPKKYEFVKLKGENLIDWGRVDREKLKSALTLFGNAAEKFPKYADPVIKMLYINIILGNDKAIEDLFQYLNQNYSGEYDKVVHTKLAEYFIKKGKYFEAKKLLMILLGEFPDYPFLYYTYAMYYKAIKSKEDEEIMLNLAISKENTRKLIYPWDKRDRILLSNAYNELGEIYANLELPGKSAEAIRYFKRAIDENPDNKRAYFNLAQVYFYKEKDYDLAERYYKEALSRGFTNDDLIYNLGVISYYRRNFKDAVENWMKLSNKYPGNPNISFALACALLYMKRYEAALGELLNLSETYDELVKELGEIKPYSNYHRRIVLEASSVYNNLGVAYEKLYELKGNPEYQKKALISLYRAGELADIIGIQWGKIQYNLNYILHPDVIRADMAIADKISENFRFIKL